MSKLIFSCCRLAVKCITKSYDAVDGATYDFTDRAYITPQGRFLSLYFGPNCRLENPRNIPFQTERLFFFRSKLAISLVDQEIYVMV